MLKDAPDQGSTLTAPRLSYLARQPILDRRCRIVAYELLFREGPENVFSGDATAGSAGVIAHGSLLSDMRRLSGGHDIYVNLTEEILTRGLYRPLPAATTVLEVLETIEPEPAILAACRRARREGYRIALDDVVDPGRLGPFADVTDLVKVDLRDADAPTCLAIEARAHRLGLPLLAEKVETEEEFGAVRDRGYSLFQGYFLGRPKMLSTADVPANKLVLLELIRELNRPEQDAGRLDLLVRSDVALCFKLLRYINAVHFGFRDPIRTVRRAIVLLGMDEMRRWSSLAALSMIGEGRPPALIHLALTRGRFYELLAPLCGLDGRSDDLFLTGILSTIDAVLQRPLEQIVCRLPVGDDVKRALIDGSGALAETYRFALAYEAGDWNAACDEQRIDDPTAVSRAYVDAMEWADRTASAVGLRP